MITPESNNHNRETVLQGLCTLAASDNEKLSACVHHVAQYKTKSMELFEKLCIINFWITCQKCILITSFETNCALSFHLTLSIFGGVTCFTFRRNVENIDKL